jgi:hypothetical protein
VLRRRNITGQRFGKLVVVKSQSSTSVVVQCDCGAVKTVEKWNIIRGRTLSCAGKQCKLNKTHGATGTKTYDVYLAMRQRCLNPNCPSFRNYGARGITICESWLRGFDAFFADMGHAPVGLQLERRDNEGSYSPENCYWATPKQQSSNTRCNHKVTVGAVTKTVAEWAAENGINRSTAYKRINRSGWDPVRAVTEKAA